MRLAEDGVVDLDTPLVKYLDKPLDAYEPRSRKAWHENLKDLAADPRHARLTARMCLAHTTGLPNWRWFEPDQRLRIKTEPGTRYSYSGEGLTVLQVVLERLTGKSLEEFAQEKIFAPYGMTRSSYTWQPRFETDYGHGHDEAGKVLEKDKDNAARSASTLETTLDDYTRFLRAVLRGDGLKASSRQEMFSTQISIRSKRQFGPLSNEDVADNDKLGLGYGLGWGVLEHETARTRVLSNALRPGSSTTSSSTTLDPKLLLRTYMPRCHRSRALSQRRSCSETPVAAAIALINCLNMSCLLSASVSRSASRTRMR